MRTNSGVKGSIIFLFGCLVGAGSMYIGLKKYFENKANTEIEQVKAAFGKRIDEVIEERDKALGVVSTKISNNMGYDGVKSEALKDKQVVGGIVSQISSKSDRVDYTSYFKGKYDEAASGVISANSSSGASVSLSNDVERLNEEVKNLKAMVEESGDPGGPQDDDPLIDDLDDDELDIIPEPIEARRTRPPRIIKEDDYGSMPGYDYCELYYYVGDKLVVDVETDTIIDNPEYLIGDSLTKYGFADNAESRIYVRNEALGIDYEVEKKFGSYEEG